MTRIVIVNWWEAIQMPGALTWTVGIIVALIIGAALVYILGFIVSMIATVFYLLVEGVEHLFRNAHMPHIHMPHRHHPVAAG